MISLAAHSRSQFGFVISRDVVTFRVVSVAPGKATCSSELKGVHLVNCPFNK